MKTRVPAITVFGLIATLTTLAALCEDPRSTCIAVPSSLWSRGTNAIAIG